MTDPNPAGAMLPRIRGESLAREAYEFPRDLSAAATLLLVAFRQWQQREVDGWLGPARALAERSAGFAYFEIPLIGRRYRPIRWFIDGGMRAGITDPAVRATTVTAFQRVGGFLEPLGIESTESIVVVLVDRRGVIRWAARGEATANSAADLETQVRLLTAEAGQ